MTFHVVDSAPHLLTISVCGEDLICHHRSGVDNEHKSLDRLIWRWPLRDPVTTAGCLDHSPGRLTDTRDEWRDECDEFVCACVCVRKLQCQLETKIWLLKKQKHSKWVKCVMVSKEDWMKCLSNARTVNPRLFHSSTWLGAAPYDSHGALLLQKMRVCITRNNLVVLIKRSWKTKVPSWSSATSVTV